ncbi:hypothetical protein ACEQ8H_003856 [Pleosporales sp. CAS-2024a]
MVGLRNGIITNGHAAPSAPPDITNPTLVELQRYHISTDHALCRLASRAQYLSSDDGPVARAFEAAFDKRTGEDINIYLHPALVGDEEEIAPEDVQVRVHLMMPSEEDILVHPPNETQNSLLDVVADLVDHLDQPDHTGIGDSMSVTFPAPEFHFDVPRTFAPDMASMPHRFSWDASTTFSIMPCGSTLALECTKINDHSIIQLFTGVRVYFVWPPTDRNMDLIKLYFAAPARGHEYTCEAFEGGVTFVQRPGQTLLLPPYCPRVVFSPKLSTAAFFDYRIQSFLHLRLRYFDLTSRQLALLHYDDEEFDWYNTTLSHDIMHLDADLKDVLYCDERTEKTEKRTARITALAAEWDGASVPIQQTLDLYSWTDLTEQPLDALPTLWAEAMMFQETQSCLICQREFRAVEVLEIAAHFRRRHWALPAWLMD